MKIYDTFMFHDEVDLLQLRSFRQIELLQGKRRPTYLNPGEVVCGDDWNREDLPDFFKTQIPNLGITERFWAHQI